MLLSVQISIIVISSIGIGALIPLAVLGFVALKRVASAAQKVDDVICELRPIMKVVNEHKDTFNDTLQNLNRLSTMASQLSSLSNIAVAASAAVGPGLVAAVQAFRDVEASGGECRQERSEGSESTPSNASDLNTDMQNQTLGDHSSPSETSQGGSWAAAAR